MQTRLLVIQKINEDGVVNVFETSSNRFQWAFENKKNASNFSPEYFPFIIMGDAKTTKRVPGPETETLVTIDQILFSDDYGVPDGSVIGILFPKNYIPDVLKFKEKPYIPVGLGGQAIIARPPGQMQILYNQNEKRAAIILHIHERLLFGIKCLAKKVADENFPNNSHWMFDDFDITISRELLEIDAIKTEDLKLINETINKVDIEDINKTLNEILSTLKKGDKATAKSNIGKLTKSITNGLGAAANMTKLIDSYNDGGAPKQFISQILKYIHIGD